MKYNCETCKYSTDRIDNWTRHSNSKLHIKKVQYMTNKEKDKMASSTSSTCFQPSSTCFQPSSTCFQPSSTCFQPSSTCFQPSSIKLSTTQPVGKIENDEVFICPHCDKSYGYKSSLLRHIDNCASNSNKGETNIVNRKEVNSVKIVIEELKKSNEELKKDKEYLKSLVTNAGKITATAINATSVANNASSTALNVTASAVNSSTSALKYIMQNFTDAPLLKPMDNYLAIKNDCGDQHIAIFICDHYNDKTLVKYLGCKLLEHYKKSDPANQSLWASDCSRLNYIIRSIVENEPGWIIDKKGIKIKKLIVTPLLNHIRTEMEEFVKDPKNLFFSPRFHTCVCIINDIRSNVISDDLIRFLSPYFHFTQKT
jgi:hypothetical protein